MNHLIVSLFLVAAVASCSPDCQEDDRIGSYMMSMTERENGTCGPMPDMVTVFTDDLDPGCMIEREVWSDDVCTLERTLECDTPEDDITMVGSGVTTQLDDDGDEIEGTMTITAKSYTTGSEICTSTYDVTYSAM